MNCSVPRTCTTSCSRRWCSFLSGQVYYKQLCRKCQAGINPYRVEPIVCKVHKLCPAQTGNVQLSPDWLVFRFFSRLRAAVWLPAAVRRSTDTSTWTDLTVRTCAAAARAWGCPATPPPASSTPELHPLLRSPPLLTGLRLHLLKSRGPITCVWPSRVMIGSCLQLQTSNQRVAEFQKHLYRVSLRSSWCLSSRENVILLKESLRD